MTAKVQSPSPFSRFSIFKSPASSPHGKNRTSTKGPDGDDNWYIPYNGPYEAPRQPYVKPKERDSWGDSVYGDSDYDDAHDSAHYPDVRADGWYSDAANERTGRPRARTESTVVSQRPPLPAFTTADASGGVGESPSPRVSHDNSSGRRTSFANLFTFGSSSGRKLQAVRPLSTTPRQPRGRERPAPSSGHTDDEEYYTSYYSGLVHSPLRNQFLLDDAHRSSEDLPSSHTLHDRASPATHPYASYTLPLTDEESVPHTAPLVSTNSNDSDPFRSAPMRPSQSTGGPSSNFLLPRLANQSLKNSVSSPDLRNTRRSQSKPLSIPKGRERWLSPETWCDALFLPRPRFKVKQDGSINYGKRVVSPPGSPVVTSFKQADMMSRVLAHSRSMVDLQQRPDPGPSTYVPRDIRPSVPSAKSPRPKSFALDDLALPSPAPSLSRVLEEGQILEHQRKKWQMQAQGSFQNSRTRSLSRARTKSQTKKEREPRQKHPHMDFLAARSFAGNQDPIPLLTPSLTESRHGTTKSSHTYSHSLSKTLSTTKTHSRTHSRNDSWGKSAMKLATGFCNPGDPSPLEEKKPSGFEDALHNDGTRVIRFEDPSLAVIDPALLSRNTPSQASSADIRVGIALSTPPVGVRESIHLPSHPYAQGGMYTYNPVPEPASPPESERIDLSLRHRLPPRATPHPYALHADRERETEQPIPQVRVEKEIPNSSKIHPDDIKYSPFISQSGTPMRRQSGNIYDMVGVAEALANAVRTRESRDSGFGGSDEHPYSTPAHRQPVEYDVTRPIYRQRVEFTEHARETSTPSSAASTPSATFTPLLRRPSPQHQPSLDSPSMNRTPDTSSSQASPRPLGSPDDLDNFRDLFYRPTANLTRKASTRSQLTNLARQLSQEFVEMNQHSDRHLSHDSSGSSERSRDDAIHFVFSDMPEGSSGARVLSQRGSILPFHPSISIPEDVEASSIIEKSPDDESDEPFRLGHVEHLETPPATSSAYRTSLSGQFVPGHRFSRSEDEDDTVRIPHEVVRHRTTSLQPPQPPGDPSRTSYTTNSTYSRMSNLSDFPVPPVISGDTPGHMSLLSSYFESAEPPVDRRVTFGGDAEIDELLDHLNHGR